MGNSSASGFDLGPLPRDQRDRLAKDLSAEERQDILANRASNYPDNPIDDWAAGVPLDSRRGMLWFNDGGRLVKH